MLLLTLGAGMVGLAGCSTVLPSVGGDPVFLRRLAPAVRAGAEPSRSPEVVGAGRPLPWVRLAPGRRYFETEDGAPFLVIGQNDSLTWPELEGLIGRRDVPAVDRHLA